MDFNKFQWDDFIDAANSRLKRLETIWKWLWDENLFNISHKNTIEDHHYQNQKPSFSFLLLSLE